MDREESLGRHPLLRKEFMELVFGLVGEAEYVYVASVCREWRGHYLQMVGRRGVRTSPAACLASPGRLELACGAGLGLNCSFRDEKGCTWTLPCWAGRNASLEVIQRAMRLGMEVEDPTFCFGAAQAGRLDILKELYDKPGYRFQSDVALHGSCAETPEVVSWLREVNQGREWDESFLKQMLLYAAQYGRVSNAKWLMDFCGATFHPDIIFWAASFDQVNFLEWAVARGCPWNWDDGRCAILKRSDFHDTKRARDWLHAQQNFPCSCDNSGTIDG